jgi:chemotaxis protein histidine kinase CheA
MANDSVEIQFGAKVDELLASMEQLSDAVKESLDQVGDALKTVSEESQENMQAMRTANEEAASSFKSLQDQVSDAFGGIQAAVSSLTGILGGLAGALGAGKIFKDSLEATLSWGNEVAMLSQRLGISAQKASDLAMSLKLVGMSADSYTGLMQRLERQVRTNSETLENLGIVLKNSDGSSKDLVDVLSQARDKISQYATGAQQAAMSMAIFGGRVGDLGKFLRLTIDLMERGKKAAKELALEMSPEDVEATHKFEEATAHLSATWTSFEKKLGAALMGTLQSLADFFNNNLPKAVEKISGDIHSFTQRIVEASNALANFFGIVKNNQQQVDALGIPIGVKGEQSWVKGYGTLHYGGGFTAAPYTPPPKPPPKQSADEDIAAATPDKGSGAGGGGTDLMAQWEAELEKLKNSQADLNAWSEQKDYEFWNTKLAAAKQGSETWQEVWNRMADIYRSMSAQAQQATEKQAALQETINKNSSAMQRTDSESAMKMAQQKYDTLYALGQINAQQRAALEKQADDKAYQEALTAEYKQLDALHETGTELIAKQSEIYREIEKLQQEHLLKMQKADDQAVLAMKKQWDQYVSEVGNAITGLLFKHQSFLQTVQNLTQQAISKMINWCLTWVENWALAELKNTAATTTGTATRTAAENSSGLGALLPKIWQSITAWVGGEAAKTTATTTGAATRTAAETASATAGHAQQSAMNVMSVMSDAAVAFAGAYAAMASIPYVGPMIAPAVASEAMASVMAMAPMASLDVGAWDVPRDMFARIHAGEMVVPENFAQGIRKGGTSNDGPRGAGDFHLHIPISTPSPKEFHKMLKDANSPLMKQIKTSFRDYHLRFR